MEKICTCIKNIGAYFSYLDTESWCFVYAYIIHKATDPSINLGSLQGHHAGGGSTPSLYPDLPLFYAEEYIPLVFLF